MIIQEEVERLLKSGMIREVKFPKWLANVVVVQKKNGKWRVCVDFTDLKKVCPKDHFPLPHIDSMVDATAGHEMLTFMDASLGFQQIHMEPSDQEVTAFMTPTGIYCYIDMPFGLKNAGGTYQRLVNMMFKEKLGYTMEVYIDDMVVKSKGAEDHLRDIREAFDILDQYNMKLNPSKCHFEVGAGKFLGYMEFYDILKKNKRFEWEEEHEQALQSLKEYLSSAPLLMKPEDGELLSLYLAVSRSTISNVLVKDHEGQQHPVYYVSKSLLPVETRYSHLEKLILALIMASTKLRHYFETHAIHVKTNYPIKCVLRKPEMSGRMAKWPVKLSAYDLIYEPRIAIKPQTLVDFVADFNSYIQHEADLEVQQLEESKDEWTLFTYGVSNVGGRGLGVILKSPQGDIIPQSISLKGEKLSKYLTVVKQLSMEFQTFNITQVPREDNTEADTLANLDSALKIPEGIKIPIIHILSPVIEKINEVSNTEEEADIQDLESSQGSWILPIKKYLQDGEIPSDEKNHNAFRVRVSRFIILQNVLYRKSIADPYLRCLEDPKAHEVLKDIHEGDCGNHNEGRALFSRILMTGYYWPTMRKDAVDYS
ncbi:hypothetical protein L1987_57804 [Smallanthus sonchifolius]|uniref:Uncharacterized protein n=1 Tax=Smallanthus sonchifolius TaxID=185202 RepID=A0ACB9DDJ6_9ASTR|nr:hypothetical protein L1987_57804 [Smallanthus sonchifolius]